MTDRRCAALDCPITDWVYPIPVRTIDGPTVDLCPEHHAKAYCGPIDLDLERLSEEVKALT